jgi:hypothetical protein
MPQDRLEDLMIISAGHVFSGALGGVGGGNQYYDSAGCIEKRK